MSIIDIHHHLVCEKGYPERLLREMDALGIERTGLIAMGPLFESLFVTLPETCGPLEEKDLLALVKAHPDRFFGYVFIRPGHDTVEKVRRWHQEGFSGLKFHIPTQAYDSEEYFDLYGYAEQHRLPCLFHSGIFYLPSMKGERVASKRTHPICFDTIANEFPDLRIIIAHIGGVWAEIALSIIRIYKNVYGDISSRLDGWKSSKPASWFKEMVYWPEAPEKLMFGSDTHSAELKDTVDDQLHIIRDFLGWDETEQNKFFFGNANRLFD